MPKYTAWNILTRYAIHFGVINASDARHQRPKKLNQAGLRQLEVILVQNWYLSHYIMTNMFDASGAVSLGMRTLPRYNRLISF